MVGVAVASVISLLAPVHRRDVVNGGGYQWQIRVFVVYVER